jgi:OHCU decarboxylase
LAAFAAHPRIGDVDSLRTKFAHTKTWASGEQAGVDAASEDTLIRLADGNDAYFDRFGYIFIVCATGKSADQMLALLEARLPNDAVTELPIAAAEQRKITQLRLQKLAGGEQLTA